MAVPTIEDIRARFAITSQFSSDRLTFALESALGDVEDAIGTDIYNEIFEGATSTVEDSQDDLDTTTTNEEARRTRRVTHAVYYKALANVISNANTRIRSSGSVLKEHDAASPGSTTEVVNEYMNPSQIAQMVSMYESKAGELLQPYLIVEEVNMFTEFSIIRG